MYTTLLTIASLVAVYTPLILVEDYPHYSFGDYAT